MTTIKDDDETDDMRAVMSTMAMMMVMGDDYDNDYYDDDRDGDGYDNDDY